MSKIDNTLYKEINKNPLDNSDDIVINTALQLYTNAKSSHWERDAKNKLIKDRIKKTFELKNITSWSSYTSALLHNVIFKFSEQMKPLDYQLICEWKDSEIIDVQKSWLNFILEKSWFMNAMRDKWWVFENILSYWDAFLSIWNSSNRKKGDLIKFRSTDAWRVFVSQFATKMRSPSSENEVDDCLVIYNYSWDQFCEMYPDAETKATKWNIPTVDSENLQYSDIQEAETTERNIEVAHYYNKVKKIYTVFAWSTATKILEFKWDKYPFIKNRWKIDESAYIPLLHFMCFPSIEWFYNYWIAEKIYQIDQLKEEIKNNWYRAMRRNINAPQVYNIASGSSDEFFAQFELVQELNKKWEDWIIVNEVSKWDSSSKANVESLTAPAVTQDLQIMIADLEDELVDMWINLKWNSTDAWKTARALLIEEENKERTIIAILEQNTSEWQFAIELVIEYIKSIPKSDDTPVIIDSEVELDNWEMKKVSEMLKNPITLWDIWEEFRKHDYRVLIDSRSGSYQSKVTEAIRLNQLIWLTAWTPAQKKIIKSFWKLYWKADLFKEEAQPQQEWVPQEMQWWWGAKPQELDAVIDKEFI